MSAASPWVQTTSGRAVDLLSPTPEMIDFRVDIPDGLARISRFNGAVAAGPYSVAQHCVIGADHIYRQTQRAELAGAFLLHDAHEAYIGDIVTPVVATMAQLAGAGPAFRRAMAGVKEQLDAAIYAAAGMPPPTHPGVADLIKSTDLRLMRTERDHLMHRPPQPWPGAVETLQPLPLKGRIKVLPWADAADAWRDRLQRYCPLALPRAA